MHTIKKIAVLAAALALAACNKEEEASWSRLPGESAPPGNMPQMAQQQAGPMAGSEISAPPQTDVAATTETLTAVGLAFRIPEGWMPEKPATSMRLAQYSLPGNAGPAEMTIFYFGQGQGGDTHSNLQRWVGQFTPDSQTTATDGTTTASESAGPEMASFESDGLKISLVRVTGTYSPTAMGPMAPPQEPQPDQALFGLVIEGGPEGTLFVKTTGPRETMQAQAGNLEQFAKSVRRLK